LASELQTESGGDVFSEWRLEESKGRERKEEETMGEEDPCAVRGPTVGED